MKLTDFYRSTVDLNDSKMGGWGSIYYGAFRDVINANGYTKVAEVGIGYGTHAKDILSTTAVERLYLVDPMVYYPNDGFAEDIMKHEPEVAGNNFNEFVELIRNELSPHESRYTWFRTPSLSITNEQIPDGSLDCIFVDGDHSYGAVLADLTFWWKKLRVGGQMLGDDYWMNEVANAVSTFASTNSLTYDFVYGENKTYKIFRFHK